jgi:hypothetical protein
MKPVKYSHIHQQNAACQENIRAGGDFQGNGWEKGISETEYRIDKL